MIGKDKKKTRVLLGATLGAGAGIGAGLLAGKYLRGRALSGLKSDEALLNHAKTSKGRKAFKKTTSYTFNEKNFEAHKNKFRKDYFKSPEVATKLKRVKYATLGGGAVVGGALGSKIAYDSTKQYVPPTQEQFERSRNKRRAISTLNSTSRELRGWVNTARLAGSFL